MKTPEQQREINGWRVVAKMIRPLTHSTRIAYIQALIQKCGPVPDECGDEIRALLSPHSQQGTVEIIEAP